MEKFDFSMHRCETFHKALKLKKNGEPVDLTGYTAKCQVRENPDGGKLLCEVETIITPEIGLVDLFISSAVSSGFESGVYTWDIRITSDDDVAKYYLGGWFRVLPSTTE